MRQNTAHLPLSERLIEAGLEILLSGQPLTLRGAAARAGVSHGAPAHHFAGLAGLQTAIAARAYHRFADHLQVVFDAFPPGVASDEELLMAMAQSYCGFAAEQGALFQLMFAEPALDWNDPDLTAASARAYAQLQRAAAPFARAEDDRSIVETLLWCIAHGYATLGLTRKPDDQSPPVGAPSLDLLTAKIIALLRKP